MSTSEHLAQLAAYTSGPGVIGFTPDGAQLPPGWPDVTELSCLANRLFAEAPGGAQPPESASGFGFPDLSQPVSSPALQTPAAETPLHGGAPSQPHPAPQRSTAPHAVTRTASADTVPLSQPHPQPQQPPQQQPRQPSQQQAQQPAQYTGYPPPSAPQPAIPASHGSDLHRLGAPPAGYGLPDEAQLQALLQPAQFGYGNPVSAPSAAPYYFLQPQPSSPAAAATAGAAPAAASTPAPGATRPAVPQPFGGAGLSGLPTSYGTQGVYGLHGAHGAYGSAGAPFDVERIRRDFPILQERVGGRQLVWLDNAATTHKPNCVIDRLRYFYEHENSNIHRAAHELAARATDAYEGAREKVRGFLNAASPNEIVFVRGATEAINLVAQSWGRQHLGKDDEIVISWLEHHANIVPWQQLCAETGAKLRVAAVDDNGQILLDDYARLLGPRTRLVSFTQVSNALGTITPAKQMVEMAHAVGARVLVDGAQAVSHLRADVQYLNCDWYVFSGHKVFGPTGIGVLYGKEALLNATQPWQGGGNMIKDVRFEHTEYHQAPGRFEAGTGNIADAVGLGAAIDYVNGIGIDNINQYEHQLLVYATGLLQSIPGLRLIGTAPDKASVLSFVLEGYKTEDVGAALSREGIAVRSGHHCAQPILRRFGVETSVRPSLAFYNNWSDVDALVAAVRRLKTGHTRSSTAVPR